MPRFCHFSIKSAGLCSRDSKGNLRVSRIILRLVLKCPQCECRIACTLTSILMSCLCVVCSKRTLCSLGSLSLTVGSLNDSRQYISSGNFSSYNFLQFSFLQNIFLVRPHGIFLCKYTDYLFSHRLKVTTGCISRTFSEYSFYLSSALY